MSSTLYFAYKYKQNLTKSTHLQDAATFPDLYNTAPPIITENKLMIDTMIEISTTIILLQITATPSDIITNTYEPPISNNEPFIVTEDKLMIDATLSDIITNTHKSPISNNGKLMIDTMIELPVITINLHNIAISSNIKINWANISEIYKQATELYIVNKDEWATNTIVKYEWETNAMIEDEYVTNAIIEDKWVTNTIVNDEWETNAVVKGE
ncbi:LOW QUALITY PROTEIN: hypothetical protein BC938DRAFT_483682 [Jimgerdemannia flammicorona]|uniref:Uncharacterized protein n=1 Tax=Jimgerdemannia flammicorona TaxID=994334 RepID=A0A433QVN8_9FUNG|nr:LOW QUALITY PROTEIN: hypothetical protein BC938DRAFT_483682 [Jimgerdemannia flammicorona]